MSVSNEVQGWKRGASDINGTIIPIIAALMLLLKLLPSGTYINNRKQHQETLVLIRKMLLPRELAAGCWPYLLKGDLYGHSYSPYTVTSLPQITYKCGILSQL